MSNYSALREIEAQLPREPMRQVHFRLPVFQYTFTRPYCVHFYMWFLLKQVSLFYTSLAGRREKS